MRAYRRNGVTLRDVVASELRMKVIEPKTEGEIYRMDQSILMADLMEKLVEIYDSGMDETAREIAIDNLAFDFHKAVVVCFADIVKKTIQASFVCSDCVFIPSFDYRYVFRQKPVYCFKQFGILSLHKSPCRLN
jgi:hypothetical protein